MITKVGLSNFETRNLHLETFVSKEDDIDTEGQNFKFNGEAWGCGSHSLYEYSSGDIVE